MWNGRDFVDILVGLLFLFVLYKYIHTYMFAHCSSMNFHKLKSLQYTDEEMHHGQHPKSLLTFSSNHSSKRVPLSSWGIYQLCHFMYGMECHICLCVWLHLTNNLQDSFILLHIVVDHSFSLYSIMFCNYITMSLFILLFRGI